MPDNFWNEAIVIIFFVYGLAFYTLGLALLVESGRASELGFARSMRILAGFGLLHGSHEWIDMLERAQQLYYNTELPEWLLWLRLAILITSFLALMAFGEHLLSREGIRQSNWTITLLAAGIYAVSCIAVKIVYDLSNHYWLDAIDVLSRYIIGIPGALLACFALWRQRTIFRERGMDRFVRDLTIAAIAFALYGVVGQVFPKESEVFPSNIVNAGLFQEYTGFPIQLLRAAVATVVAISMIRVLRALEIENQQRLKAAERAQIETEQRSRDELARLNTELQAANDETSRLLREVRRRDALRGELLQRITAAQEAERKRIARELHDGTGQTLTGLALGLRGLTQRDSSNSEHILPHLSSMQSMATEALGELRILINDLRPPQLDDMGLAVALRWMAERFNERGNLEVRFEICGDVVPLPSEVETTLFRIAQEALTNTFKHAQAQHVHLILDYRSGLTVTIQDDGIGFDVDTALEPGSLRTAWGLIGMQERVNLISAELTLESVPREGTRLSVHLNDVSGTTGIEDAI